MLSTHENNILILVFDKYPKGDPNGRTHTSLFKQIREKEIQYFFGKLRNDTDKMIEKFKEAYEEPITEFDVSNVNKICESVSNAVTMSVQASILHPRKMPLKKLRKFTIVNDEPDWTKMPVNECTIMTYDFPKSINDIKYDRPFTRKTPKKGKIMIAENPFAQGSERIAYYGKYLTDGSQTDVVFKEYKDLSMDTVKRYEISSQTQIVAAYLAGKFTEEIGKFKEKWVHNLNKR